MFSRIVLSLLLLLSAPLTIAQHAGCATDGAGEVPLQLHHQAHGDPVGAVVPGDLNPNRHGGECDGCSLACQLACAAVALPSASIDLARWPMSAGPASAAGAALLHPHRLPLLRPPSPALS